ncbi:FKBP-type peptidyl-prolyl cis-trans isomerase [Duganella sp. BuS-21]|uniref:FKBP-type peptidyl-prolyl cis-trans isomerase n=1 Tax=Duganella sp. BuS-21 TaxID=2943848 RepID=UPI0035A716EB
MLQFIAVAACAAVLTACGGGAKTPTVVVVPQPDYKLTTLETGTGLTAATGDTVTVQAVGWLYDATKADLKGAKMDSTIDTGVPVTGTVGVGVLPTISTPASGWDQALLGMQPGGKRLAVLPAALAFGANSRAAVTINNITYAAVPANSPLVYEFTMVNVTKAVAIPSVPPPTVTTITEVVVGTGATATVGKAVTVRYTGWLYDGTRVNRKGTQFDSNVGGTALAVTVGTGVVAGFSTGLTGMQVGGKRTVIIPPDQGYGSTATSAIPANSTLVFDIELLTVN